MKKVCSGLNRRAFTLIEMLVTAGIILVISTAAVMSFKPATGTTAVVNGAQEVKSLVEELKSFSVGPDRERAAHYILIIQSSGTGDYCNNTLNSPVNSFKQFIICSTTIKDITNANLDTDFNRVVAGHLETNVSVSGPTNPIILNIRTYDSQMGYDRRYPDTGLANPSEDRTITVSTSNLNKNIVINLLRGTINIP